MKKHRKRRARPKKQHAKEPSPVVPSAKIGSLNEPLDPCAGNFFDYMLDMYAPPDQVELRSIYSGWRGPSRDAQNIRRYFRSAISRIAAE